MTGQDSGNGSKAGGCGRVFLIVMSVVVLACLSGFVWLGEQLDDDPPSIGSPYDDAEAFLVMEALAGELITALPDDEGAARFSSRTWDSDVCRWGWNDYREWEGLVSVSIRYGFPTDYLESEETGIEYAELIIEKLEELGIDPEVDYVEQWNEMRVTAQRDDGLSIHYDSTRLYISAGCVPDDGRVVYTPPHGGVPPAGDGAI